VAGIPSWCEVETIRAHAERVDAALREAYPDARRVVVLADNDSPDGTVAEFALAALEAEAVSLSSPGRGKGLNFRLLFEAALELDAAALLTFDADLEVVPSDWVPALAAPILAGEADLVVPLYGRHWYDGNLTNQVAAPLVAAVTDKPVRQPIAGEFGFSPRALGQLVDLDWPPRAQGFGVDAWCVLRALRGDLKLIQRRLSAGKLHSWRSDTASEVAEEMQGKFDHIAGLLLDELAPVDWPAQGPPPPFPASAPLGPPPKDYGTGHLAESAAVAWRAVADSEELPALAPWADTGSLPPVVSDAAWAETLALALRRSRAAGGAGDDLLVALKAVFLARIASVLPGLDQAGVEPMVAGVTAGLRDAISART
jgi:hypothetical protein